MSHLSLAFLGQFQVSRYGQPINAFGSEKAQALLAYLATDTRVHQRNILTALLWPDYRDDSARTNLRQTLHRLRQAIGEDTSESKKSQASLPFILSTRETLQFNLQSEHDIDVRRFTTLLLQCEKHPHNTAEPMTPCAECLERMNQAVELYRGEFLEGFDIAESVPFEEWRRLMQERLHLQMVDSLHQLTTGFSALGQYGQAYKYVSRWVNLEPYSEAANRQMMSMLAARGDRNAALDHFQSYRLLLASELKIEPHADTIALYGSIRARKQPSVRAGSSNEVSANKATTGNQTANQPFSTEPPITPLIISIPTVGTSLIGRADVLSQLTVMLERPECRLLTLHGPPGVGKTRLAIDLANRCQATLNISVCFVELAAITDPVLVLPTVARALGINMDSGRSVLEVLTERLYVLDLLLVLDNFEQVMIAAEGLDRLLSRCMRLKIVVTSRVLLHIRAEQRFAVDPLQVADAQGHFDFDALSQLSAVQLFVQRAQVVKPDFALTSTNATQVAELCRHLDGLPLAIELAAARIRVLSISTILARMRQPLQFLRNDTLLYSTRQQTLSNAIAWSYTLLRVQLQCLFHRLAVFVDGFTLESAEAVCGLSAPTGNVPAGDIGDVLDGLEALLDHSLLRPDRSADQPGADARSGGNNDDEPRFRMLESIRAYAVEQLQTNPSEAEATRRQHAQFFLTLAEQAEPLMLGPQQSLWLKRVQTEHNNFRAALDWLAHPSNANDAKNANAAMRLVVALRYFWYAADYLAEGLHQSQRALAHPLAVGRTAVRAGALNAAAYFHHVMGQADLACPLMEEALSIGREVGDKAVTAYALQYIAVFNPWRNLDKARAYLEESIALFRTLDRPFYLATALVRLGDVTQKQQAYDVAEASYEESIALLRQVNNRLALPFAMRHQAYLLILRGNLERAATLCTESLAINIEMNDLPGVAACLLACAVVALKQGKFEQSICLLAASDVVLDKQQTKLLPADVQHATATLEALRAAVGPDTFARTYAAGQNLTFQQAVKIAHLKATSIDEVY